MKLLILVNQYIIYRKSLGEKFLKNESCLKHFCREIGENVNLTKIPKNKVNQFLYGNSPVTSNWFFKYSVLSGFYHYVISRGYINYSPLPLLLPTRPPPFVPYIYSREELRRIFKAALIKQKRDVEPYVVYIILILLYGTGLRLSELLSLTMNDVDISQSIITVHQTKFCKTRFVPFGKQLAKILKAYSVWRNNYGDKNNLTSPFVINKNGNLISIHHMEVIFKKIRKIANIYRMDNARYQPRLHDLRHTFAVHRLISWYKKDKNVQALLPILSTYLGHTCIADTSIYLTMTTDLLNEAGIRFEKYATGGVK